MNVDELAAKYGLTNEWIEESAAAYERGDYPHEDGQVYSGSHLDAVGEEQGRKALRDIPRCVG